MKNTKSRRLDGSIANHKATELRTNELIAEGPIAEVIKIARGSGKEYFLSLD